MLSLAQMLSDHPSTLAAATCEYPSSMHGKPITALQDAHLRCRMFQYKRIYHLNVREVPSWNGLSSPLKSSSQKSSYAPTKKNQEKRDFCFVLFLALIFLFTSR